MPAPLYTRLLQPRIVEALADTPVVLVNGPRQAGKTTLVRQFAGAQRRYLTLDDELIAQAAREDAAGLLRSLDGAVIDEVQHAPGLLQAIKRAVDQDRRPGRFLLTGSANLMLLPKVTESLAGRMETLSLLPLAGCEMQGGAGRWIDAVFAGQIPQVAGDVAQAHVGEVLVRRVLGGGYPEAVARPTQRRRNAWTRQYVDGLITRDVRDIATVEKLDQLPRLLNALTQMAGQLCNFAQLAGQVGLDNKTAEKYLAVFEHMFLLRRVAPWSANGLARIVKSPKIHFIDAGLLGSLLGLSETLVGQDRTAFGHVLESYVYGELLKLASWAREEFRILTYRDLQKVEVDFVLEDARGNLVGVEVKASATVRSTDFSGIRKLASLAGKKFKAGVVLFDGTDTLPMGPGLWAVPLSTLWLT